MVSPFVIYWGKVSMKLPQCNLRTAFKQHPKFLPNLPVKAAGNEIYMVNASLWTYYKVYGNMTNYRSKNIDRIVEGWGALQMDFHSWGWYWTRMFSVWNYLPFVSFTNTGQPYRNNTLKTEVQSPLCMEQFMLQGNSCYSCTELLLVELFCVKNGFSFCLKTTYPSPQIYL